MVAPRAAAAGNASVAGNLARANHAAIYVCLFLMPLAGYLGSVFSGYPVKYFGIALPAWGWKDDAIKNAMSVAHFTVSWLLLVAVVLHVAGALKHWHLEPGWRSSPDWGSGACPTRPRSLFRPQLGPQPR